jgi:hypothetical protein
MSLPDVNVPYNHQRDLYENDLLDADSPAAQQLHGVQQYPVGNHTIHEGVAEEGAPDATRGSDARGKCASLLCLGIRAEYGLGGAIDEYDGMWYCSECWARDEASAIESESESEPTERSVDVDVGASHHLASAPGAGICAVVSVPHLASMPGAEMEANVRSASGVHIDESRI